MSKIRIIVQQTDATAAAHVGGPPATEYLTFDVEAPELVAHMRTKWTELGHRSIVGVEILSESSKQ
jgi:hypothetical protein